MDKKDFLKEKYIKEKAVEYFPNCFDKGFNLYVVSNKDNSIVWLEKYMSKWFEKINLVTSSEEDIILLSDTYNYIKSGTYNLWMLYLNNSTVKDLLAFYNNLISDMSDYHFKKHSGHSYGATHNKTNKQILFEISLLYPVLIDTLKKVDKYLATDSDSLKSKSFREELVEWNLKPLISELGTTCIELENASGHYHKIWNAVNRPYYYDGIYTNSDLGDAKKKWKVERNKACHTIYEFYQDIMMINKAIDYEKFDTDESSYSMKVSEIEELYNYAMENIATGPNYYCYLTSEERIEDRNANVLKKAIRK